MQIVLGYLIPATITVDTETWQVTEYLIDENGMYPANDGLAELHSDGSPLDPLNPRDMAALATAQEIAATEEWPRSEEM